MSRFLLAICSLLTLFVFPPSARADHEHERDAILSDLLGALRAAREELASVDGLIDAAANQHVQREIHSKVHRLEELLDRSEALSRELGSRRDGRPAPPIVIEIERPPVVIVDEGPSA